MLERCCSLLGTVAVLLFVVGVLVAVGHFYPAVGRRADRLVPDPLARGRGAERDRRRPPDARGAERDAPPARRPRAHRGRHRGRGCEDEPWKSRMRRRLSSLGVPYAADRIRSAAASAAAGPSPAPGGRRRGRRRRGRRRGRTTSRRAMPREEVAAGRVDQGDEDRDADRRAELPRHAEDGRAGGEAARRERQRWPPPGASPGVSPTPMPPSMKRAGRSSRIRASGRPSAASRRSRRRRRGRRRRHRPLADPGAESSRGRGEDRRHQRTGERAKPARSSDQPQTSVSRRTPERSIAPKPMKKTSVARLARAKERTRSSGSSITGARWWAER